MALVKRLTRIGSSTGIILDQPVLKQAGLEPGDDVELVVRKGAITIRSYRSASDKDFRISASRVMTKHRTVMTREAKK